LEDKLVIKRRAVIRAAAAIGIILFVGSMYRKSLYRLYYGDALSPNASTVFLYTDNCVVVRPPGMHLVWGAPIFALTRGRILRAAWTGPDVVSVLVSLDGIPDRSSMRAAGTSIVVEYVPAHVPLARVEKYKGKELFPF
jgi:hypothetical protein